MFAKHEKSNSNFTKVNFQIRCPNVRVIQDGEQLGIMPTEKARKTAQDQGLDLVETVSNANPPVCHIIEYEKYRYQLKQKEKEAKRKQKEATQETKEVRLKPRIHDHDIETKITTCRRFLEEGKKVQLNLIFKNREIAHKEEGFRVVNKIVSNLTEIAHIERAAKLEGFKIICRLEPKEKP